MLIIPLERPINWRRPPWATLMLIVLNLLVFSLYQSQDQARLEQAVAHYLQQDGLQQDGLQQDWLTLDAPVYEAFLERQIALHNDQSTAALEQFRDLMQNQQRDFAAAQLLMDRDFYAYVQAQGAQLFPTAVLVRWQADHAQIKADYLDKISLNALGLIPAELQLSSLVSYAFLHGGWGHLLGNMLFLFLLGFTVEQALGAGRYLIAYLLCGVFSGLIYAAFNAASAMPMVGASGAISGLMGMYVAIFGLQRIRFFYFAGVYFDYFKAPALAVLPVWLGKELYDYGFAGATGVAYMAHAGGLITGAALVWLLGKSWLQVKSSFFEPDEDAQEVQFRHAYGVAMASLSRFDFTRAGVQFDALAKRYPNRPELFEHRYHLARLNPAKPTYRECSRSMLSRFLQQGQLEPALDLWREYQKLAADRPLQAEDYNRLLFACLKQGRVSDAEKVFESLLRRHQSQPDLQSQLLVQEACRLLLDAYSKQAVKAKVEHYRQLLQSLEPT